MAPLSCKNEHSTLSLHDALNKAIQNMGNVFSMGGRFVLFIRTILLHN
jgi:predicted RNA-binding protein YlqC (UPF0109 family)